jgi:hypothetical protein
MPLVQLCTQFHPIAFPEIPLYMNPNCCESLALAPIFYQKPFRKFAFFSDRKILAIGKVKCIQDIL